MEATVFNKISTMPRNNNGEITILTEHLDVNNTIIGQQFQMFAHALFEGGGVLQAGSLSTSGHDATLTDFVGLNRDGIAVVSSGQSVNLSTVPTNSKCVIVVEPDGGDTITVNIIDSETGEGLAHTLRINTGRLAVLVGTTSEYPFVSDESVVVAKVTRGSSNITIDEINTSPPEPIEATAVAWGNLSGNLTDQTDLVSAFGLKADVSVVNQKADASTLTAHTSDDNNPHGVTAAQAGAVPTSAVGSADGVAELDSYGRVLTSQLPSYVSDVSEHADYASFPGTGDTDKIYVALDTGKVYRWGGTVYAEISASLTIGETNTTAARGDHGKTAYDHSQVTTGNPHGVTAAEAGAPTVADLINHVSDDDNPHGVTAAEVGAPTTTQLADHVNDQSNPHGVTLGQIGAMPVNIETLNGIATPLLATDRIVIRRDGGTYHTTGEHLFSGVRAGLIAEDAFSPALESWGNSPPASYDYRSGRFARIGDLVHMQLRMHISNTGEGSISNIVLPSEVPELPQQMRIPVVIKFYTDTAMIAGFTSFFGERSQTSGRQIDLYGIRYKQSTIRVPYDLFYKASIHASFTFIADN